MGLKYSISIIVGLICYFSRNLILCYSLLFFFFFFYLFFFFVILLFCFVVFFCYVVLFCFILFQWTFKEGFVCTLAKNTHDELFFFFQSMGGKRSTFCHQICHCFMLFFIYCVPATCLYVCSLSWIVIVVFKAASGIFSFIGTFTW